MNQLIEEYKSVNLQPSVLAKLDQIYQQYAKNEQDNLKHSEWLQLIMEKGLISNTNGLQFFYKAYREVVDTEEAIQDKTQDEVTTNKKTTFNRKSISQQQYNLNQMKAEEEAAKQRALLKDKLTKPKFNFLNFYCAKNIFNGYKNPLDKFLEKIFIEAHVLKKMKVNVPKFMQMDETNKKLLSEQALQVMFDFEFDMQRAFTVYNSENISRNKIMLTWEEIAMLNKQLSTFCFVNLLSDANMLTSTKITIEMFEDYMSRILPSGNSQELNFYQSSKVVSMYQNDLKKKPLTTKYTGDPKFYFHEFQLMLTRIAIECCDKQNLKTDLYTPVAQILNQEFGLRNNKQYIENLKDNSHASFFKQLNTQYAQVMLDFYNIIHTKEKKLFDDNEEFEDDPQKILQIQIQNSRFLSDQQPKQSWVTIRDTLNEILPPMPKEYVEEPEFIPTFEETTTKTGKGKDKDKDNNKYQDYAVIGIQPPKPPADKNKQKSGGNQKKNDKKDKDARVFPWAGMPGPEPETQYDHFNKYNQQLEFENPGLQDFSRGVMSNIQIKPVQLDEVLYPKYCPDDIIKYLESGILLYTEQNFAMSLDNINYCYDEWLRKEDVNDLEPDQELFFEYFKGQIYQSAGREDLALSQYFGCKAICDKMPSTNPNRAIAYCGIGNVLFRMEEYKFALRSYLLALDYREIAIGSDNADVATIQNNIGCCMQMLERNLEASCYFELAHAIFDLEFGPFHTKTSTAKRNYDKSKHYLIARNPPYKQPWITYIPDENKKKKKGGKKKK